jgi:chemotaxis signal transduction protein
MNGTLELDLQSFVLLRLGDRQFAVPATRISELVPTSRIYRFPHRTPELEGVLVRRGRIVPICDVSEGLTGTRLANRGLYLLALRQFEHGMECVALPLTGECELVTAEMTPASGERLPHVQGWISHDGSVIEVLDLDHLIPGPGPAARASSSLTVQEALP